MGLDGNRSFRSFRSFCRVLVEERSFSVKQGQNPKLPFIKGQRKLQVFFVPAFVGSLAL